MNINYSNSALPAQKSRLVALIQMIFFSAIGIVMFFIPFQLFGKSTILFDHIASYLVREQRLISLILLTLLLFYGTLKPFITGNWKKNITNKILSFFKIIGLIIAILYLTDMVPTVLSSKDMLPFLFEKLALPVGMIVPIGALILAFLIGFGLLEMVGVLMQPIMRPIWRTPGTSAIDAVASFVGSYSVALLITNRVYLQGQYSAREAVIIATGFSTVSTAFMVIIAKTLNIMPFWMLYFWSAMIVTFLVTAITARLPPISRIDNNNSLFEPDLALRERFKIAFETGISTAQSSGSLWRILWLNLRDGIEMAAAIVPSILAIGLFGLVLAKYTPVFDLLGLILYPFTWLVGLAEPLVAAKGISSGLAEMFLPSLILADMDILTRFVVAIVSVSSIIFFSAMIPCLLATQIPLSIPKMLIIWFQRTSLSIVFAGLIGQLALFLDWLK
ncbi:histidine transporter [Vespertiliibacter pulmonis]|uniref:Nucleoside recognition membrane protein YjiH n=1 Tax=Vespertiliibacter pulmonis TaxID=1443036 RepID=A0A3N4VQ21_9PAST|nr:YjiH family protein [Vespertiliibacter pulmonis]QLB21215.1 histidine transporter [Vespertiliibacter pulmonis]RPE83673.1 nucleoside recognition membrane protein YjiH [Vespertiliibacter pulmonis]